MAFRRIVCTLAMVLVACSAVLLSRRSGLHGMNFGACADREGMCSRVCQRVSAKQTMALAFLCRQRGSASQGEGREGTNGRTSGVE